MSLHAPCPCCGRMVPVVITYGFHPYEEDGIDNCPAAGALVESES